MRKRRDARVRRGEAGFSLVELLIVVALIVIMAAIAVPNISGYLRLYKIRGTAQQVAGQLQQARSKAIMGNTNRGVVFVVVDADSYRWVQEDELDAVPTPASPLTGALFNLPVGIRFVAQAGGAVGVRFNRLGAGCVPGTTGCASIATTPFCTAAEATNCNDVPSGAGTAYINFLTNPQMYTVTLLELATNMTRTVQVSPGGRVMVQP